MTRDRQGLSHFRDRYDSVVFDTSITHANVPNNPHANRGYARDLVGVLSDCPEFVTHHRVEDELRNQKHRVLLGQRILETASRRVLKIENGLPRNLWMKIRRGLREAGDHWGLRPDCGGGPHYADFSVGCLAVFQGLTQNRVAFLASDANLNGFVEEAFGLLMQGDIEGVDAPSERIFSVYTFLNRRAKFSPYSNTSIGIGA